jgi:hypothetical protein
MLETGGAGSLDLFEANGSFFFGSRLLRFMSLSALGIKDEAAHRRSFRSREIDLLTTLVNSGNLARTYELRIISRPDAEVPARGSIEVTLLSRLDHVDPKAAELASHEFVTLLQSSFPEYEMSAAASREIEETLSPFEVKDACSIRRRVTLEQLDTIGQNGRRARTPLGFRRSDAPTREARSLGSIPHFYSFVPRDEPFSTLFRLLLTTRQQVAISVTIKPGLLTESESAFFETAITECERYGQSMLLGTSSDDLSDLYPVLKRKTSAHQNHLSRLFLGIQDNMAIATITLMSDAPLSPFIIETVGGLVSGPAGTGDRRAVATEMEDYLTGGYEIIPLDAVDASRAAATLDQVIIDHPNLPAGAHRLTYAFDTIEASAAFLLPPISSEPLPGVETRNWRRALPPREMPLQGVLIGETAEGERNRQVRISDEDRLRHVYAVGQTGTGKTTLLKTMIVDDMHAGRGVCVLDPHGDLYRELLGHVPEERIEDVILIDPTDTDYPIGLNVLEYENDAQRHFIVQEFSSIIQRMMFDQGGDASNTWMGPMFFQHVRMNLLLAMSDPDSAGTLLDFYNIFQQGDYWTRWLPLKTKDPLLERWVKNALPKMDYLKPTSEGGSMGSYISSKFEGFVFDPMLRNIFSQQKSTIDIAAAMDAGKIILVNLAKGELTETNSRFFGMIVLAKIQAAALRRSRMPRSDRKPFYLYVDEFQSIATEGFITLLSEGRKFGLGVTLANQFVAQIRNEKIMSSVFGNVGTLVCMRLGEADAERMEKEMAPTLCCGDLLDIPNWRAYIGTIVNGQTVRPFEMKTLDDWTAINPAIAHRVVESSRRRHSRGSIRIPG